MKRLMTIMTILAICFSLTTNAQVFDGVPISGDLPTAISKFKAKGYQLTKYIENGALMKGKIGMNQVELYIFVTPKSKKVFKCNVYFEERSTWASLKADYFRYLELMESKYGEPDSKYDFFSSPYDEGDGYEMTAVVVEKATFSAFWLKKDNANMSIAISKYKQVQLTYENVANMELKKKEVTNMEISSF